MVLEGYQRTRVLRKEMPLRVTNQRVKTFSEDQKKPWHHEHHLSLRLIVVTPHQFEKSKRIAHGMDLADLAGVNGADCEAEFFFMSGNEVEGIQVRNVLTPETWGAPTLRSFLVGAPFEYGATE